MNQREIGELLGVDYSAVRVGRKRYGKAMEKDRGLEDVARRIEIILSQK